MKKRILIVEDDAALSQVVCDILVFEGFDVELVTDGDLAVARANQFMPDLVLLDLTLPGRSGFDLCDVLRRGGRAGVIILTARGQKADKVRGLGLGADDYVTKPFDVDELLARIRAVIRRTRSEVDQLTLGSVVIDFVALRATSGTRPLHLTRREFDLLHYLAERSDRVVYRDELLREIWGYPETPNTRSVDHAVARLRKKIEEDPRHPRFVLTVHGDGYQLRGYATARP
jgi:two-component system, OmpR family, response regulator MtrA